MFTIDDHLYLRPLQPDDAPTFFDLIQRNRDHLDAWLRWSGRVQTLSDAETLIQTFADKHAAGDGFHLGIWYADQLVGGLVCHYINRNSHKSEIGYWLGAEYVGQGLVTHAALAVLHYLFEVENLNRVEIQCAVDNVRSRAVPERLGFVLEGIKRESEWLTTRFADHAVYSMLQREWAARV